MKRWLGVLAVAILSACQASTTRPGFVPMPEEQSYEVRLTVPEATRLLAAAIADSFPLKRVEERDGYLETEWFSVPGFTPVKGRALNSAVDKIRGWIDPGPPFHSVITVEIVYRFADDPSRDPREFERPVHETHTARRMMLGILKALTDRYGDTTGEVILFGSDTIRVQPDTAGR